MEFGDGRARHAADGRNPPGHAVWVASWGMALQRWVRCTASSASRQSRGRPCPPTSRAPSRAPASPLPPHPQGADHTCGLTIRAKVDHLDPKGQMPLSRNAQINMAGYDTLGACVFTGFGFSLAMETIPALLNARYGWETGNDILQQLGKQTLLLEREFNRRAGFTAADDRLPEWMTREPLPPHQAVFDVSEEDLDTVFDWS